MSKITYPFCLVMATRGDISLPVVCVAGYIAAFSNAKKAADFMIARGETDWKMTLVSRPTFAATVESLRSLGVRGLCFDQSEQSTGEIIDFDQVG